MAAYENWHVLTLYVAKEDVPRAHAENGPSSIQALLHASLQIGEDIC
jgi:hypothetical protein